MTFTEFDAPVYLVDDDAHVRDAVSYLLGTCGIQVRAFASGPAFLAALPQTQVRGVFLLDVRMEPLSGQRVFEALLSRGLRNPVLFLTGHGDIPMVVDALKKGAFDFLEKPYGDNLLVERVQQALSVEAAMQQTQAQHAEREARLASLTEREREVMVRVAQGKLNKVIADELGVAMRTVEVHRARVYAKLGVHSSAEVATLLTK